MVADTVPLWLRRLKLTDKQWYDIQRASGLPDAGRWQIEHALAVYAALRAVSVQPASETRKELRELVELADNLMTATKQLSPGAFAALMPPAPQEILAATQVAASGTGTPKRDAWQQFAAWSKALGQLRSAADLAARSLAADKRGAYNRAEANQWLVGQLAVILIQHAGRHISRGKYRDYVKRCFALADPNIGDGSVDEALRKYMSLRARARGEISIKKQN